jgi:hypothetical protein
MFEGPWRVTATVLFLSTISPGGGVMSAKVEVERIEKVEQKKIQRKQRENEVFGPYCFWL